MAVPLSTGPHSTAPLIVTPGEPAGIGPEILAQAVQQFDQAPLVAIVDPNLLAQRAELVDTPLDLKVVSSLSEPLATGLGTLNVLPVKLAKPSEPGTLDTANAPYVLETLTQAAKLCMAGEGAAIVTAPVQKSVINDAGVAFSGHTEFFAELSNTPKVVMMLATDSLRVALASTHIPLKEVSAAITHDNLRQVLRILIDELNTKFRLTKPTVLVAGLNPHAGENGHLGMEEIDVIQPVLEEFQNEAVNLVGPLPADTLFTPHHLDKADAVLAMYHDQGLPVLKHLGFGKAVNITLGLPFVRTSVDHGTALDLAGTGQADPGSLLEALRLAHQLTCHQG